jgi:hypothetical protein
MSFNPLWWVHLKMSGGWRGSLLLAGGFFVLVIFFYVLSLKLGDPEEQGTKDTIWLAIMTGAEALFLTMVAPGAIRKSVLRDFQSGMIESHRLTPMSNWRIVMGYMTGPTMQAAMLCAVGLVLGTYFSAKLGSSANVGVILATRVWVLGWYIVLGTFLAVAFMLCAFTLLTSIASAGKTNVVGVMILVGIFGGWMVIFVVPGLSLVLGVMTGMTVLDLLGGKVGLSGTSPGTAAVAALLQVTLGVLFLNAACGKLRRPEGAIFTVEQALLLGALWSATLVTGMALLRSASPFMDDSDIGTLAQLFSSTGAFVLVALFASHSSALDLFLADRAAAHGERTVAGRQRRAFLVPVALAAMTVGTLLAMLRLMPLSAWSPRVLGWTATLAPFRWIALAFLLSFLTDFAWLYRAAAHGRKMILTVIMLTFGLKAGPVILDAALLGVLTHDEEAPWTGWGFVSGLSPMGTMILSSKIDMRLLVGLAVQAAVLALSWMVFLAARRATLQRVERIETPPLAVAVG